MFENRELREMFVPRKQERETAGWKCKEESHYLCCSDIIRLIESRWINVAENAAHCEG